MAPMRTAACLTFLLADESPRAGETAYDRRAQEAVHKALQRELARAGFTVVQNEAVPHDLVAKLRTVAGSRVATGARMEAVVVVEGHKGVVDKLRGAAAQARPDAPLEVATLLVDQLFQSHPVAAFSRALVRDEEPRTLPACAQRAGGGAAATAATGAAPVDEALPELPPAVNKPASGASQPDAYALVVGVEAYSLLPHVAGARADAERFAVVARRVLGVDPTHLRLVTDQRADRLGFDVQLSWLKMNVKEGSRLYFFFSGYGAPKRPEIIPYLMPQDADPAKLDATAFPLYTVLDALAATKAKEIFVVLDAGFSGAGVRSALPPGGVAAQRSQDFRAFPRTVLLAAASGADVAGSVDHGGGLLAHYVTAAIDTGRADVDGDGTLSLHELVNWVRPRVVREAKRAKREQNPVVVRGPGTATMRDFVVASGLTDD